MKGRMMAPEKQLALRLYNVLWTSARPACIACALLVVPTALYLLRARAAHRPPVEASAAARPRQVQPSRE